MAHESHLAPTTPLHQQILTHLLEPRPTDGSAFNVSVRQAEVTVSEGTDDNAGVVISGLQAQLLGMLLGRVDISRLTVSGNEVTALQFPNAFLPP